MGVGMERGSGTISITVRAINVGHRDITLNSMGYILPDKRYMILDSSYVKSNVRFPCTLSEGKECTIWETQRQLALALTNRGFSGKIVLSGYYTSAIGTIFKSNTLLFDIGQALTETE